MSSLEIFRAHPRPEDDKAKVNKAAPRRRPLAGEAFVRLPYRRVIQLYGRLSAAALFVLIELDHQHFKGRGQNPLKLTNQTDLSAAGMPRCTKARALRELRDVGLITLQKEGREAFVVTLSWHPVVR
jgi:DNA-binding transcriptional ArsR family regulator